MFKKTKLILRAFLVMAVIVWAASPSFAADKPAKTTKSSKPSNTEKADTQKPIKRIDTMLAVFDLETTGKIDKDVSRPLTDSIRLEVVRTGKYKVIDRSNMDKILGEQKLQLSGCVSGECIVEAGQLLGVGRIITGSVSMVGKTYYLSLSLINVESGEIEKSSEDECKCELEDLIQSSKRLVKKLLGEQIAETETTPAPAPAPDAAPDPAPAPAPAPPPSKGEYTYTPSIKMVFVKGGCYQMGCGSWTSDCYDDEKPVHEVCIDDFYIGKYEVTQGQWKAVMGNNPSYFKKCGGNCPVENVSWDDAQDFINKLNNKTGKNYRLPTEAEWEYAARSGGKSEKYSGSNDIDSVGWYTSNSGSKPHPVGQKTPNSLGIYDMSGNVWKWCNDWYDGSYYKNSPKDNPKGPNSGSYRVARGGGWINDARDVRASLRYNYTPYDRYDFLGFRLVRTR